MTSLFEVTIGAVLSAAPADWSSRIAAEERTTERQRHLQFIVVIHGNGVERASFVLRVLGTIPLACLAERILAQPG